MSNRLDESVKPGDVLDGKYLVERVLGSGGMGVVVQARHKTLNKRVAIKFMRAEALRDGESVARFQREANAAASLQSEHTARVQDTGRLADGAPYMVMEFLTGKDLGQLLEESGAQPYESAVALVLQACEALAEAHARGIIHRDIKPRNLFLAQRVDGRPLLKVLDFGLAKHVESGDDHALTRTTAVMGSPQYMSPEQMRASRDVDRHTDIWSLGVCLYELLTGTVPFDAPTVPMLCALVLKEAPKPPNEVRLGLPAALAQAVMRCLEKEPSLRYDDVGELADVLEPFGGTAAAGAASRVRGVLATAHALPAEPSRRSFDVASARTMNAGALDETLVHSDTKTAASFDSKPSKMHASRTVALRIAGFAAAALGSLAVVVVVVLAQGRRDHGGAAAAHSAPPPAVDVSPAMPEPVSPLATSPASDAGVAPIATMAPIATLTPRPAPITPGGGGAGAGGGARRPPPPKPVAVVPLPQPPPPPLPTAPPPKPPSTTNLDKF